MINPLLQKCMIRKKIFLYHYIVNFISILVARDNGICNLKFFISGSKIQKIPFK